MHKYQAFVVTVPVLTVFAEGSRRIQIAPGPLAPAIIRNHLPSLHFKKNFIKVS